MLRQARQFVRHVIPGVVRPLHTLWNEILGVVFLALAIAPLPRVIRTWNEFSATGDGLFHLILAAMFMLLMGAFGIDAFRRARRISRS
jgi:hypothetical protein